MQGVQDLNNGLISCGYTGTNTDWRIPNAKEMMSLVDYRYSSPAISEYYENPEFPFFGISRSDGVFYWTSTTQIYTNLDTGEIHGIGGPFVMSIARGSLLGGLGNCAWPVRGPDTP